MNKPGRPQIPAKDRLVKKTVRIRPDQKEWLEQQEKPSEKVRECIDLVMERDDANR